jgi:hypothetical protein
MMKRKEGREELAVAKGGRERESLRDDDDDVDDAAYY